MQKIPLNECKDRVLYRISSRNLTFGVFNKTTSGFIGIREKFDCFYLFTEYHYDTGEPYGTVNPKEELESMPDNMSIDDDFDNVELFNWLEEKESQYRV